MVLISDGILETLPQTTLRDKQAFLLDRIQNTELDIENLIQVLVWIARVHCRTTSPCCWSRGWSDMESGAVFYVKQAIPT